MLNDFGSTLLESGSTSRPFTKSFSAQAGAASGLYSAGGIWSLHNVHESYNMPTMPTTLSSRNSGLGGVPSSGAHQTSGSLPIGRFSPNNLPVGLSQLSPATMQGHTGISNRAAMNIIGNHSFSSSMNGGGASLPGASPGSPGLTTPGGLPGAGVSQSYIGGAGHRITGSISTIGGIGSNNGRTTSAGTGLNVPGLGGSRVNLGSSNGNNGLGIHGPGRPLNSMLQQGTFNQGQFASGSGQFGSIGLSGDGAVNDGAAFDLNDFPQLTSRPSSSGGSQQGSLMSLRKHSVSSIGQQNQEFSMQNEDFPALPGFKGGSVEFTGDLHQKDQQLDNTIALMQSPHLLRGRSTPFSMGGSYVSHRQQQPQIPGMVASPSSGTNSTDLLHLNGPVSELFQASHGPSPSYHSQVQAVGPPGSGSGQLVPSLRSGHTSTTPSMGGYEQQLLHHFQHHPSHSQFRIGSHQQQLSAIGQSREHQSLKHMQGIHTPPVYKYGLLGLLNVIRMSDPDLTTLALGTDLTTLGLNLNSRDNLNKTFASPWAEGPIKGEPDFTLPQCYIQQAPRLQAGYFSKFQQHSLFYIFYSMPNDEAQLYAANELCNRGWFYHKESCTWLTCVPNVEPLVKTNTYERGSYFFFDPNVWETGRKDNFVLQYEMVEKRPQLP